MRKILFPLSFIYGFIILIRNIFYDKKIFKVHKFSKIIISVGNITAGGTGKTPTVEFLIDYLMKKQKKIAVISRGYRRKTKGFLMVSDGKNILNRSEDSGDEPYQIATKFPQCVVGVDENRSRMTEYICKHFDIDAILLDDAFQHRKISRDLDIVCINARQNPFSEYILPAGNRREQLSGFKRADYILINKCRDQKEIEIIRSDLNKNFKIDNSGTTLKPDCFKDFLGNFFNLNEFQNKRAVIFSGIGDSDDFRNKITDLDIRITRHFAFHDHYHFKSDDIRQIIKSFKTRNCDSIITTEKDYFRIFQDNQLTKYFKDFPFYYLTVKFEFLSLMENFTKKIDGLFNEK